MCQEHCSLLESPGNKTAHKSLMKEKDIKQMYKQVLQVGTVLREKSWPPRDNNSR